MKPMHHGAPVHTFRVADKEHQFLAFRDEAAQKRNVLERELATKPEIAELVIDFRGVDAMTNSYADELIGKFYVTLAAGDAGVSTVELVGLS